MATVLREKRIKSADRVLEILEMFNDRRQMVTVMDVSRTLDYPQSSTSELLGSLVKQGYLSRDRAARTYRPTARVALLGAWVEPSLFRHGRLLPMIDALNEASGEAVVLGSVVGTALKHVHAVGEDLPARFVSGTEHHLLHSPLGRALLSMTEREYVRKLVHRLNAESEAELRIRFDDLAADLDAVRAQGYAIGPVGGAMKGIAVLLPQSPGQERLSLGLIAPAAAVEERREDLVREIRGAVSSYLGPIVARSREAEPRAYAAG